MIELEKRIRQENLVQYYRVIKFHEELLGFKRPCNSFELMHLLGSEKSYKNFEKVKLDEKYISMIPLKRFAVRKAGTRITDCMNKTYPWYKLALSIIEEGIKTPLIVLNKNGSNDSIVVVVEGKHRIAALGMIKPYNPEYLVPSIEVMLDHKYTISMYKQPHPDPAVQSGFRKFEVK